MAKQRVAGVKTPKSICPRCHELVWDTNLRYVRHYGKYICGDCEAEIVPRYADGSRAE